MWGVLVATTVLFLQNFQKEFCYIGKILIVCCVFSSICFSSKAKLAPFDCFYELATDSILIMFDRGRLIADEGIM